MQAKEITLFGGLEYVKWNMVADIAPVFEIEYPFRTCKHAFYIRISWKRALVLGRWVSGAPEEIVLLSALRGKILDFKKEVRSFRLGNQQGERRGLLDNQEESTEDVSGRDAFVG